MTSVVDKAAVALGVRLTVRRKLIGLTVLGLVVAAVVGVIGIRGESGLSVLNEQGRSQSFQPMSAMAAVKDAELVAQMAVAAAVNGQLTADQAAAQLQGGNSEFDDAFNPLQAAHMNGGEGPEITVVGNDWKALTAAISQTLSRVGAGNRGWRTGIRSAPRVSIHFSLAWVEVSMRRRSGSGVGSVSGGTGVRVALKAMKGEPDEWYADSAGQ